MKNIFLIIKKEFRRFFFDRRMVFGVLLLPGVMIFLIYTLLGGIITDASASNQDYKPTIFIYNITDESFLNYFKDSGFILGTEDKSESPNLEDIKNSRCDLIAEFPDNYLETIKDFGKEDYVPPTIKLYYESTNQSSTNAYGLFGSVMSNYKTLYNVNPYDGAEKSDMTKMMLSTMLPYLVLLFLFAGCMAVAPESIAGEKERGTIATLLVTPIRRHELALGKIFSLSGISVLCGLSSFIGTALSLPKLYGGSFEIVYGAADYLLFLVAILSTVFLFVALLSVISAFAKTVKEATALITPIMIIVMIAGILTMVSGLNSGEPSLGAYFIPAYNSALFMQSILAGTTNGAAIAITVCSNLAYAVVLTYLLTRMFSSEKIMFNK